jgi:hypothetical protein
MYPAQALADGLYSIEDLPDTVVQVSSDVPPVVTVFTKLSSPQTGDGGGGAGTPTTYFSGTDSNGNSVGVGIYSNDEEPKEWKGTTVANESSEFGECLFSAISNDPLDYFSLEDQFADTYYLSATNNTNPNQSFSNIALSRQSLCIWRGSSGNGNFLLAYFERFQFGIKDCWFVQFTGIDGTLSGLRLNNPVGPYQDRFNYSNISISE